MQIFITFLYKIQFSNYDKRKNLRCLFFFFWPCPMAGGILVPWSGIEQASGSDSIKS